MGLFSWLDCCDNSQISCREIRDVYVLVPVLKGGGHILEKAYNGYGDFGGYDIYDLVAQWNRDELDVHNVFQKFLGFREPVIEDYCGLWDFEKANMRKNGVMESEIQKLDNKRKMEYQKLAMCSYKIKKERLIDFINHVSDEIMTEKYGNEWLREIGINLACNDFDNRNLPFPIKITHNKNAVYENESASMIDPNQGC